MKGLAAILAVAIAIAIAIAPASAAAAPGWNSAPVSEAGALAPTGLEFAADGGGVLTWDGFVPGHRPNAKLTGLALRLPAGTWTRGPDVPGVTWGLARVHVVESRTVMVAMRAYAFGAYNRARWEVVTATGRLDGSFATVRAIARDVRWTGSAVSGCGEVLAAWVTRRDDRLRVARPGGRAHTLSPAGIARPLLVAGANGHVLAAWTRGHRIEARRRTPAGRWGPVRRVSAVAAVPGTLHGAVSAAGRAIVAWGAIEVREDRPGRWRFAAAASHTAGSWAAHLLESYTGDGAAPATALPTFDARGRGLVAWAGAGAVKVARPDGRELQRIAIARPVTVDAVALSRTGELALAYTPETPGQGPGAGPFAVTAPSGGAFGAPIDVGVPDGAPLQGAKLAFDPVNAQPTVAWTVLSGGVARLWTATRNPA